VVSRGTARRKLVWATFNNSFIIASTAHNAVDLLANLKVAGSSVLGGTVMRTHVSFGFQWGAVTDFWQIGLIVGRGSDIGTAQLDPNSNPGDDWMLNMQVFPHASGATVDAATCVTVDNRSKRKLEELDQTYLLSVHNGTAGSHAVQVYARSLVAMP